MSAKDRSFEALWRRLGGELPPVKPLAPPWRRAAILLVWTAVSLIGVLGIFGLRQDCERLGAALSWLPMIVAIVAAYGLLIFAGREALPGAGMRPYAVVLWCLGACGFHFAIAHWTHQQSPLGPPPQGAARFHATCIAGIVLIGAPLIVAGLWSARQGLVLRPWAAGCLSGVAAAVVADAVWRLHCPFTSPRHVLLAHSLPYVLLIAGGTAALLGRKREKPPAGG